MPSIVISEAEALLAYLDTLVRIGRPDASDPDLLDEAFAALSDAVSSRAHQAPLARRAEALADVAKAVKLPEPVIGHMREIVDRLLALPPAGRLYDQY